MKRRCVWAANGGPLDQKYHDREWGVPVHSDRKLFEFLILEGAQAVGMVNDHTVNCFRHRQQAGKHK